MKRTNPSKAQLRRDNARLQRAAQREMTDAKNARAAMMASDRMRDNALQLLCEVAPDLLTLLVRPTHLPLDPGGPMVRSLPKVDLRRTLYEFNIRYQDAPPIIEHWITRMRMEIDRRPELYDQQVLCFRMQRPKGKDSLAWQHAFTDSLVYRSPTGLRYMIMAMADRLCDELEKKIGGGCG